MSSKILIVVAVVVIVFLIVVALQPSRFRVERSLTINASPATIFPHINDLQKAAVWSPWLKMDPAVKIAYSGPASGVGASSSWVGNNKIGEGRQTIIESQPGELVRIKLEFFKPMAGVSTADFSLKPADGQTTVTWSIYGENNFISKAFCLFMRQDKMIGTPFEMGLANLKTLVESSK
ncbi:MAG: SRPBCC family protein [Nibricoccus sp.]